MSTTPDELLERYAQASSHDDSVPSPRVRTAVLHHAASQTFIPTASSTRPAPTTPDRASAANQAWWTVPRMASVVVLVATGLLALLMGRGASVPPTRTEQVAQVGTTVPLQNAHETLPGTAKVLGKSQTTLPAATNQVQAQPHSAARPMSRSLADSAEATLGDPPPADPRLLDAARAGDSAQLGAYLRAGAWVDTRDASGQTALMIAAEKGHLTVAQQLLAAGADKQLRDHQGNSALVLAQLHHSAAIVRLLQQPAP